MELFRQGDSERQTSLELKLKLQQVEQELKLKESAYARRQIEVQGQLQSKVEKIEQLSAEVLKLTEKAKHGDDLSDNRVEMETKRTKASFERKLADADERDREHKM